MLALAPNEHEVQPRPRRARVAALDGTLAIADIEKERLRGAVTTAFSWTERQEQKHFHFNRVAAILCSLFLCEERRKEGLRRESQR
jgi:hypothetical protein